MIPAKRQKAPEGWGLSLITEVSPVLSEGSASSRHPVNICWTARRSNQSVLKEINTEYSLEGLMLKLKLKLQYFGYLTWRANSLEKDSDAGKDWEQEEKGVTEDEMIGQHHLFSGHEVGQTPGDGEGQGGLACCSPWGHKQSEMNWWQNNRYLLTDWTDYFNPKTQNNWEQVQ